MRCQIKWMPKWECKESKTDIKTEAVNGTTWMAWAYSKAQSTQWNDTTIKMLHNETKWTLLWWKGLICWGRARILSLLTIFIALSPVCMCMCLCVSECVHHFLCCKCATVLFTVCGERWLTTTTTMQVVVAWISSYMTLFYPTKSVAFMYRNKKRERFASISLSWAKMCTSLCLIVAIVVDVCAHCSFSFSASLFRCYT